ncbi:MAG TPA: hypothetical protein VFK30_08790, partial [Anaerolineae bacterium]|nr:hypothetical protein [Anaerolineae bacterium]
MKELAALQQRGFDLQVSPLGITSPYGCAMASVKSSIANSTVASSGDWGAATADVAAGFSWRTNTLRIIIPISNRGPALGDPVDDPGADRDSIGRAIKAAQASHVVVSPLLGAVDRATQPNDRSKLLVLANDLAKGTGGTVIELSDLAVDPTHSIFELIDRAARTGPNGLMLSIPAAVRTLTCQRDSIKCVSVDLNLLVTNAGLAMWFTIILGFATALLNASLTKIHPPKMEGRLIKGLSNGAKRVQHSARAFFAPETLTVGSASLRRSVSIVMLIVFVGLTALFAAFIDPEFNPGSGRGVGIFLSLFFAIGLISLIYAQTQIRSARSMTLAAALRIRPLNLVIILMAALLSRVIGFLPGFVIGLPASYALISDASVSDK